MRVIKSQIIRPFAYFGHDANQVRFNLQIYELTDGRNVCIITNRTDAASLTNPVELAATWVAYEFHLASETVVWIEYDQAQWDRVEFSIERNAGCGCRGFPVMAWRFGEPIWRPMSDNDWREVGFQPEGLND